jgi:2-C-methyl-D-erythritol 4-phosphate cytidylyltransferase/2-C-methyl-D-erythritol 2,4-cyclodiphosphate synthase
MTTAAIIVAAGQGRRAGGGLAKQWRPLAGQRVIDWTLDAFDRAQLDHIVVVLHPDDVSHQQEFRNRGLLVALGGNERADSVRNGLATLAKFAPTTVLIHDAARPCVSCSVIHAVQNALVSFAGAAPGLPVTDALWVGSNGTDRADGTDANGQSGKIDGQSPPPTMVTGTQDRSHLFAAQTPQGFRYAALVAAHNTYDGPAADDVQVARAAGMDVAIVAGHPDNLKITTPEDFQRAERILRGTMDTKLDIRLGNGFDVHRFTDGNHVVLCGVSIPHDRALKGHSDADVGMHAVTDAIYGALADGDIGQHFPPSDPQWKGAQSHIFLRHAVELAANRGYRINNIDCTLVCEHPKIGPHAPAMRAKLADIMALRVDQISVKATTSERLGFTGREEGIAAIATATLVKP